MKSSSRTKAAPFKETPFHRSPCESIANNYSPSAQNLKIGSLTKRKRPSVDINGNFDERSPRKRNVGIGNKTNTIQKYSKKANFSAYCLEKFHSFSFFKTFLSNKILPYMLVMFYTDQVFNIFINKGQELFEL